MYTIKFSNGEELENISESEGVYSSTSDVSSIIALGKTFDLIEILDESKTVSTMTDAEVSSYAEIMDPNGEFVIRYDFTFSEDLMSDDEKIQQLAGYSLSDDQAVDNKDMFDEWNPNRIKYKKDISKVNHNGSLWKCITSHTSQPDWAPGVASSLWTRMDDPAEEWPEWVRPIESQTAYSKGDKVSHNGKHWVSTVEGEHTNTWEPGEYGWDEVPEESSETA